MLTYSTIENALKANGYFAFFRQLEGEQYLLAGTSVETFAINGLEIYCYQRVFCIRLKQKKIVVEYWIGQIPTEKTCENEDEMLQFLQEKFPIS